MVEDSCVLSERAAYVHSCICSEKLCMVEER